MRYWASVPSRFTVGSANMTMFSNSMELGLLSGGRAARVIANVIRALVKVARPIFRDLLAEPVRTVLAYPQAP